MKLFIALTFVFLRVLINTTATPCGGDPSPPVIILPNIGLGLGLGSSQSSSFAGSQSASGSQAQASAIAQAASTAQAASASQAASVSQAKSASNSVSSAQSNSLAISSAISQILGIEGGGIGGILSSLLGNINLILSSVLNSTQLTTLISSLIGTVNLNLQALMNILFEANGIGSVLGKIFVLLSDILQPVRCGIVSCVPLQNLISGILGSGSSIATVPNNIIALIGLVIQTLLGSVGGTEIILTRELVLKIQELLTGANGVEVQVKAAVANAQLFISETSSTLIILLQTLLGTLGPGGGLQILINIMLNGILGAIVQLVGVISNATICKLLSSIIKFFLVLVNAFGAIFIKLNNLVSTCGCGCSKNLILAILILLRPLIAKVAMLAAALTGFNGGFNIVPATVC